MVDLSSSLHGHVQSGNPTESKNFKLKSPFLGIMRTLHQVRKTEHSLAKLGSVSDFQMQPHVCPPLSGLLQFL